MSTDDSLYVMRVFATTTSTPTPQDISDHLSSGNVDTHTRVESGAYSLNNENWERIHIFYSEGRSPLLLERQSLHGDAPLSKPVRDLMDATADAKNSRGKRRVLAFLAEANYLFELTIPPDYDWGTRQHLVSTELLDYLEKETDGIIQVDGEGYYHHNRSILKL